MKTVHLLPFTIGIADYAQRLSERLLDDHGIESYLISVTEPVNTPDLSYFTRFPIHQLCSLQDDVFLNAIPEDVSSIIVHFDFELLAHVGLFQNIKNKRSNLKLIFMFHEFFPCWPMSLRSRLKIELKRLTHSKNGNIYRSRLELIKLADYIVTSTPVFQSGLQRLTQVPVICVPVFSNVGEPEAILPVQKRTPQMVVFGSAGSRSRLYSHSTQALVKSCRKLGIQEVVDIGPSLEKEHPFPQGIHINVMGPQSSQTISEVLSQSMAGFIDYSHNPFTITKSGVFAAYSAHGVVTVLSKSLKSAMDQIKLNHHYTTWNKLKNDNTELQSISTNAFNWYQGHNLTESAKKFALAISR